MKPRIFIAHSFIEKDRKHVNFFKDLLRQEGFDIHSGDEWSGKDDTVYGNTLKKIEECDAILAIFSKRDKLKCKGYSTSMGVTFETGYAKAVKNKPLMFAMVEKGVDIPKLGMIQFFSRPGSDSSIHIPEFNRGNDKLLLDKTKFVEFFATIKNRIIGKNSESHYYSSLEKEVTVCRYGYGVFKHCYNIYVQREIEQDSYVESIDHKFALGSSAKKGSKLPHLDEMKNSHPFLAKENLRFFFSAKRKDAGNVITINPISKNCSEKEINFCFRFSGPFKRGDVIKYEWLVQGPDLFSVTAGDLEFGKRVENLKVVRSRAVVPISPEIEELSYRIIFENDIHNLVKEPTFQIYDIKDQLPEGRKEEERMIPDIIDYGTNYVSYAKSFPNFTILNGRVVAEWEPK